MLHSNVSFRMHCFFSSYNYHVLLYHLIFSKLILQMTLTEFSIFFLTKLFFFHVLGVFMNNHTSKRGCFGLKSNSIFKKKVLRGTFLENCSHTNQNIPSNLYYIIIQSKCPWISITFPTELKSSSPFAGATPLVTVQLPDNTGVAPVKWVPPAKVGRRHWNS